MGYERNPIYYALSRFRNGSAKAAGTACIAYLENHGTGSGVQRPPHMEVILEGARNQARTLGYDLEVLAVGEDDHDSRSLSRHLLDRHISGIIIGGFVPGFAEIALNWDELAVAKINSRHTEPKATVVSNDQLRDVRLSLRKLRELGYRRIGLAVGRADEDACGHRHTAGYLMETADIHPAHRIPPLVFPYNMPVEALSGMMGRWVYRNSIDAVICNWSNTPEMLRNGGIEVPSHLAFASLCICAPELPGMAGIRPRLDLVGERAVSLVVSQLKSASLGLPEFPSSLYVQSEWQDGDTAPPKRP